MKKCLMLVGIFILLFGMYGVANATVINFNYSASGDEFISPYVSTTEDFDGTVEWSWSDNYAFVVGSTGNNAAPAGVNGVPDASYYVTVPKTVTETPLSATAKAKEGTYYNYFGLWWGSVDAYNTIAFLKDGVETGESFAGNSVVTSPNGDGDSTFYGDQDDPYTNRYVNFLGLKDFNGIKMTSTSYAFEADNMAVGNVPVPVPPSVWLLGSGLVGLVGLRRRFWKK